MTLIRKNLWTAPALFDTMMEDLLWSPSIIRQQRLESVKITNLETETEIAIAAPGIKKADFAISIKEDALSVSYKASTEDTPRAFSANAFSQSWVLPAGTKTKDVSAKYDAGILTLNIKKPAKLIPKVHSIKIA